MNVGIVVYSFSGHTLAAAIELQRKLTAAGHRSTLERIETVTPLRRGDTTAILRTSPAVDAYEAVVFACPVRGGTPAPPMRVYLEQIPSLEGKAVACLITGVMPFSWGRQQTLAAMVALCESKGATVRGSAHVRWAGTKRRQRTSEAVDHVSQLF
jgi:hypothetical protein